MRRKVFFWIYLVIGIMCWEYLLMVMWIMCVYRYININKIFNNVYIFNLSHWNMFSKLNHFHVFMWKVYLLFYFWQQHAFLDYPYYVVIYSPTTNKGSHRGRPPSFVNSENLRFSICLVTRKSCEMKIQDLELMLWITSEWRGCSTSYLKSSYTEKKLLVLEASRSCWVADLSPSFHSRKVRSSVVFLYIGISVNITEPFTYKHYAYTYTFMQKHT